MLDENTKNIINKAIKLFSRHQRHQQMKTIVLQAIYNKIKIITKNRGIELIHPPIIPFLNLIHIYNIYQMLCYNT